MVNTILVRNHFKADFPKSVVLNILDSNINITLQFISQSIFKQKPNLYAYDVGTVVFLTYESEELQSICIIETKIKLDDYLIKLRSFVNEYLRDLFSKSMCKMDLIKYYLILDNLYAVKEILSKMKASNETEMIGFYLNHIVGTSKIDHLAISRFINICGSLDENTKFKFACDAMKILYKFSGFEDKLNLINYEHRIYIKIKIARVLISKNMKKSAVRYLISAALCTKRPEDSILRYNLIKMAAEYIDGSWADAFLPGLLDLQKDFVLESHQYKYLLCLSNYKMDTDIKINIVGYEEIFKFGIVRENMTDSFINKIKIESEHPDIIGLMDSSRFYRAVKFKNYYIVYADQTMNVIGVCLKNKIIKFNKTMIKINRMNDIEILSVEYFDAYVRIRLNQINERPCNYYFKDEQNIKRYKNEFDVLNNVRNFEIFVEINPNIFETKKYCL